MSRTIRVCEIFPMYRFGSCDDSSRPITIDACVQYKQTKTHTHDYYGVCIYHCRIYLMRCVCVCVINDQYIISVYSDINIINYNILHVVVCVWQRVCNKLWMFTFPTRSTCDSRRGGSRRYEWGGGGESEGHAWLILRHTIRTHRPPIIRYGRWLARRSVSLNNIIFIFYIILYIIIYHNARAYILCTTAVTTAVSQIYYCNDHSSCATKYMFLCPASVCANGQNTFNILSSYCVPYMNYYDIFYHAPYYIITCNFCVCACASKTRDATIPVCWPFYHIDCDIVMDKRVPFQ